MKTVGIFFGTTGGKTQEVVDILASKLDDVKVIDVSVGIDEIASFDNLILASPTYGMGDLQDDWAGVIDQVEAMDFSGKVVGLIGVGDASIFGSNYVESIKLLFDAIEPKGAKIVGYTSTDGYDFDESIAVIDDKFLGLAIDANFDEDEISEKVESWLEQIKPEFV